MMPNQALQGGADPFGQGPAFGGPPMGEMHQPQQFDPFLNAPMMPNNNFGPPPMQPQFNLPPPVLGGMMPQGGFQQNP